MNEISKNNDNFALYTQIRSILLEARVKAYTAVNFAMVQSYWQIGKLIVEDELGGNIRGEYGKRILQNLSNLSLQLIPNLYLLNAIILFIL